MRWHAAALLLLLLTVTSPAAFDSGVVAGTVVDPGARHGTGPDGPNLVVGARPDASHRRGWGGGSPGTAPRRLLRVPRDRARTLFIVAKRRRGIDRARALCEAAVVGGRGTARADRFRRGRRVGAGGALCHERRLRTAAAARRDRRLHELAAGRWI